MRPEGYQSTLTRRTKDTSTRFVNPQRMKMRGVEAAPTSASLARLATRQVRYARKLDLSAPPPRARAAEQSLRRPDVS
eukprot:6197206-Pleurochrysis_carterae.AAC.6